MRDDVVSIHETDAPRLSRLIRAYLMLAALGLLASGLSRAALLIGAGPFEQSFEALPVVARAFAAALVFVDLLAAVGLWINAVWGPVLWLTATAIEIAALVVLKANPTPVQMAPALIQSAGLVVFVLLITAQAWLRRRAARA